MGVAVWELNKQGADVVKGNSKAVSLQEHDWPVGVRGLTNLGNTCFMSCILQAFLRAPPLRNFFLGDGHNPATCRVKEDRGIECLACALDELFQEAYGPQRAPFSPATLLHAWWQNSQSLANYEQQDAHEFFLTFLGNLHSALSYSAKNSKFGADEDHMRQPSASDFLDLTMADGDLFGDLSGQRAQDADAIPKRPRLSTDSENKEVSFVGEVFAGRLRSDVTCCSCSHTSTTIDPCVDISLHISSGAEIDVLRTGDKDLMTPATSGGSSDSLGDNSVVNSAYHNHCPTLYGCLKNFIRAEKLGRGEEFFCQRCEANRVSMKQMSFTKLPLVMCIHLKRFEHTSKKSARKISTFIHFPLRLDMKQFRSSNVLRERHGYRIAPDREAASADDFYELFAVISHNGDLEGGHYITYLQCPEPSKSAMAKKTANSSSASSSARRWAKCDDACISWVEEREVLTCQAYMLYFVKEKMEYRR